MLLMRVFVLGEAVGKSRRLQPILCHGEEWMSVDAVPVKGAHPGIAVPTEGGSSAMHIFANFSKLLRPPCVISTKPSSPVYLLG